jgi:hypothetical protein
MYLKIEKVQTVDNQKITKMKTRVLSIIALAVTALSFTSPAKAAPVNSENYTILTDVSRINKIEIYGNVELYVSDGPTDQVKVYDNYYAESALVQGKNGVLRISSYKDTKLVVWVTAADLRSISAYDNSVVRSFGNLSKIEFDVDLHNNAAAKLNLDAFSATVTLTDHAKADLSGTANELNLNHDMASSVNNFDFTAAHLTDNRVVVPANTKNSDLVTL